MSEDEVATRTAAVVIALALLGLITGGLVVTMSAVFAAYAGVPLWLIVLAVCVVLGCVGLALRHVTCRPTRR